MTAQLTTTTDTGERTYLAALARLRDARKRAEALRALWNDATVEATHAREELSELELEAGLPIYIHEKLTPTPEDCSLEWCRMHPRKTDEEPF